MAISRNIVENRKVPGQGTGPVGMNEPTFRMEMPRLASVLDRMQPMPGRPAPMPMPTPMPNPGPRRPMPMPLPAPDFGLPPRPMTPGMPPPGMGPFRDQPFGFDGGLIRPGREKTMGIMSNLMDMNPDMTGFQMFAQPAAAKIDPSDYRTIIKMIEQGLDPEDYMNRGGIASLLE